MGRWLYILQRADGSYYVGTTSSDPEARLSEHNGGIDRKAYTFSRRPVQLVHAEYFEEIVDAIFLERQLKGWSRAKKESFMRHDFDALRFLSRRKS
jgi:putative endonuclease